MNQINQDYFRACDVKERIGVSKSTLYNWKKRGLVNPRKVGRVAWFSEQEIRDLIEGRGAMCGAEESDTK